MTVSPARSEPASLPELQALVPVALDGLARMQDPATGLFSHKALPGPDGEVVNVGANPLYTAASAVGLLSWERNSGSPAAAQARRALAALEALGQLGHGRDLGLLGAGLWGATLAGRGDGAGWAARLIAALDPGRASSMQLGLALAGLACRRRMASDASRPTEEAMRMAGAELRRRYRPQAHVFAATGRGGRPARPPMTSFASQVYPLLGLCELALATGSAPGDEVGRVCDFLVEAQGERGQWWWFYSTRARRVIEGYPVYSVHQDAMAAMALLPATRLGLGDYRAAVSAGVRWVTGGNELGRTLVDPRAPIIHRAIQRTGGDADGVAGWSRGQRAAATLAAMTGRSRPAPRGLEVLMECRSYHLGWLLLAAAMARDLS